MSLAWVNNYRLICRYSIIGERCSMSWTLGCFSWHKITSWQVTDSLASNSLKRDLARLQNLKNASVCKKCRLHEAVRTSCLHTDRLWCLLSALILVNTDVYVRNWSDRCMIEVLKSRHSLSDSPPLRWSQGCCDSPHAFQSLTLYASALFHLLPHL